MPIECDCGNIFQANPSDHLRYGCPVCGKKEGGKKRGHTQEQYLEKLTQAVGDKFDTSRVVYTGNLNKILLGCKADPTHGFFLISPTEALRGHGCQKCGGNYKRTTEEFKEDIHKVHGDRYNLDLTVFNGINHRVTATCSIHGNFTLKAANFLNGSNCPSCGRLSCAVKTKSAAEETFIRKAVEKHGDLFDYSLLKYIDSLTPVELICKKDKTVFFQVPFTHIRGGGCPVCNRTKGEKTLDKILTKYDIPFKRDYKLLNLDKHFNYTFFLTQHEILIEFHGQQHFIAIEHFGGEKTLKDIQRRDAEKARLARVLKIPLIELTYEDLDLRTDEEFEELVLKTIEKTCNNRNGIYEYESKVKLIEDSSQEDNKDF